LAGLSRTDTGEASAKDASHPGYLSPSRSFILAVKSSGKAGLSFAFVEIPPFTASF